MDICGLSILIHGVISLLVPRRDNMITYRFYHFVPSINIVGIQWNCLLQTIPVLITVTHEHAFLH